MNIEPLTGRQARILLTMLDNPRAVIELDDDDYREFWQAKSKLIATEVQAELDAKGIV